VVKKDVYLEGGTENVIRIKSPQGTLFFKSNFQEYKNLKMIVRDQQGKILNVQNQNSFDRYLTGTYSVEILTLPRTLLPQVKIDQSKTTIIQIEHPGVLSVLNNIAGYGSIYKIHASGDQEWIANLENENSRTSIGMQPGNYKLVFRSKNASGSSFTEVKEFSINSGATTNIKLF
jgi:Ca-activated chloride channel family protein